MMDAMDILLGDGLHFLDDATRAIMDLKED